MTNLWFSCGLFTLGFCFLIIPSPVRGQGVNHLPVTLIDPSDGLNETDNRFVYQDSHGYTWISSVHGLYCYDGSGLRHYLPDEGDSTSLHGFIVNGFFSEDIEQNVWFSTYDAIHCYLRARDEFVYYTVPLSDAPGYFTGGIDSTDNLWFLWDTLLMTFDLETHHFDTICRIGSGASRLQVILDRLGKVYRVFIYNTERNVPGFQIIDLQDERPIRVRSFYKKVDKYPLVIRNLFAMNDTSVWIASHYGLVHFNPETTDTAMYSPVHPTERIFFNHVVPLNDSMLFIASYGRGVYFFNSHRRAFQEHFVLTENQQTIKEPLQTVFKDHHGGIWISVTGKGVAYFHPDNLKFQYYTHNLQTSQSTAGMHPNSLIELEDHSVFAGSNLHGAVLMSDADTILQQFNRDSTTGWIANNTKFSYPDHFGRIWVLTASGPCIYYPDGEVIPVIRDSIVNVSAICETASHEIILGVSSGGLYKCLEVADMQFKLSAVPGIETVKVYQYLYRHIDQRVYGSANMTSFDIYETQPELKLIRSIPFKAYVLCMVPMQEGKVIWIGSDQGVFAYTPGTNHIVRIEWLSFLRSTMVYGIVPAAGAVIWISTNQGVFRVDTMQKTYQKFNISHGTGSLSFNPHSFLRRENGEIWFGSQDGISVIHPQTSLRTVPCLEIHFQEILINHAAWPALRCAKTGAKNVAEYRVLQLTYAQNTVSFSFAAFDYSGPGNVLYEYRMTGLDTSWIENGHFGFAQYTNLRPGDYVFEVRASNGMPDSYSSIRSLPVHIIAPIYRRSWFVVLLIILAVMAGMYIYSLTEKRKRRIQQLQFEKKLALEEERLRIANDMHDDLGSGLSALSLRTRILADQVEKPELAAQIHELVNNTNRLAQQIRETIWTINSKNDTIDSLVTRLHQYALDYFEGTGIRCEVELMKEQIFTPITGVVRREIYLTFKEALHNIQKHAYATEVTIRLYFSDSAGLVIQIRDNGRGFVPALTDPGIGIASMRKRMVDIGGTFTIISDSQGTQITLTYPL